MSIIGICIALQFNKNTEHRECTYIFHIYALKAIMYICYDLANIKMRRLYKNMYVCMYCGCEWMCV